MHDLRRIMQWSDFKGLYDRTSPIQKKTDIPRTQKQAQRKLENFSESRDLINPNNETDPKKLSKSKSP